MPDYDHIPGLTLVTPPSIEPLSLSETKLYLRVSTTSEDSLITGLITAAREIAESYTKRSFITQTWMLSYDHFVPRKVFLPRGPVQSVTSVNIVHRDSSVQSFTSYYVSALGDVVVFDAIPLGHEIQVTYQAGYGAAETNVPQPLLTGMLSHIADMYENRSMSVSLKDPITALYDQYKVMRI